jgi:hypothetical protein
MRFHDFLHDCEAKSGTSSVRTSSAPEPIEDAVAIGGWDARPPIGYAHTRVAINADKDFGTSR